MNDVESGYGFASGGYVGWARIGHGSHNVEYRNGPVREELERAKQDAADLAHDLVQSQALRQACGLVVLLGWDLGDFESAVREDDITPEILRETSAILRQPATPDEPPHVEARSRWGRVVVIVECLRRGWQRP